MVEEGTDIGQFEAFTLEDAGAQHAPAIEKDGEKAPESTKRPEDEEESPALPTVDESKPVPEPDTTGEKLEPSLDREPLISPSVKALALERGVPLNSVRGTGPRGRITKQDIE